MKPRAALSDDEMLRALREAEAALPEPPAALAAAAVALWPEAAAALPPRLPWRTRLAAVLAFDSLAGPALAWGMRSASAAPRHLLFSAQGRDLDLRVTATGAGYVLTGQVLGPDESGHVEWRTDDPPEEAPRRAGLDALGEFRLEGLPAGTWRLSLWSGDTVVDLPPIVVGAPPR